MSANDERWAEVPSLLDSVWRYRWLVLAATIVAGAIGFVASHSQPEVYEASTRLYLTDPGASGVFGEGASTDLDRYVPQQVEQVHSTRVLESAAESLDGDVPVEDLRTAVEAEGDVELAALTIVARGSTGERAVAIADAVGQAYQDTVREAQATRVGRATDELETAAAELEDQLQELDQDAPTGEARAEGQISVLTQRLAEIDTLSQQLRVDTRLFGTGVEFVDRAEVPAAPAAPMPLRTAAISGPLGAVLAAALAYWLAGRSQRIAGREEPREILGVPLLGELPLYNVRKRGSLMQHTTLEPRLAEAYRFVYSSLEVLLRDLGATSVMITSGQVGAGKTETALQLAATAARRGKRTLLVDGDVRKRGLTSLLNAHGAVGLLELSGESGPDENRHAVVTYRLNSDQELDILPAGRAAVDHTGEISEWWFGKLLDGLTRDHDLTVVDSPPLLAVADTATIAAYSDAIVLVVREGTPRDELARVRQRLAFVGQRLIGYVYLSPSALDTNFDYGLVRRQAQDELSQDWSRSYSAQEPSPGRARAVTEPPDPAPSASSSRQTSSRPTMDESEGELGEETDRSDRVRQGESPHWGHE